MCRRLRSKIILSFCVLMVAGGAITTALVRHNLSESLVRSAMRSTSAYAEMLAAHLTEPLAYNDVLAVRQVLLHARRANPDVVYVFVTDPTGRISGHSFPLGRFPRDLLSVAERTHPSALVTEIGGVKDMVASVASGALGRVHVGVSTAWADQAVFGATRNVVVTTAFAMLVGIVGILFLASVITRPVLALTEAAWRLGRGEYDAVASVSGKGELADLAATFNNMARQIRERVAESEELRRYLEGILDHVASEVVVVSEEGIVEWANRLALDSRGGQRGRRCREVFSSERPCGECPAGEALRTGRVLRCEFQAPSGRFYELTYVPMVGQDGRRSVVEQAHDVTEQKQLAGRVHRAERLAVAGEVAAGVVHAINNPLDGVRRALELAGEEAAENPVAHRMIRLAREGAERIGTVTQTLLGFARADGSGTPMPVDPAVVVAGAVELVRLKAHSRGVSIDTVDPGGLPTVTVDPHGLKEVLVNLLLNAVDASDPGGTVQVRFRPEERTVTIEVSDRGRGIPPEVGARIFEPFFTTKPLGQGTGLGLSVARRIVEAHGGELTFRSDREEGTVFSVVLPTGSGDSRGRSEAHR